MALVWDNSEDHVYESGVDKGALYVRNAAGEYPVGVAWNGLISVTETPEGAEPTDLWANNSKYATLVSAETFKGSIEAYTYPDEFGVCDGSVEPTVGVQVRQQGRTSFGLAYRSRIGSEAGGDAIGYKYHLVYGAKAQPSEVTMTTINDSPEAQTFSWDFTTTPVTAGTGLAPTSLLVIDTTKAPADFITWLEEELYGAAPNLPLPVEVLAQAALAAA